MNIKSLTTSLVFINAALEDYEILYRGAISLTYSSSVVLIESSSDGIEQISQAIAKHPQIDAIHILSHGSPGSIYIGNSQLNLDNLSQYSEQLATWQVKEILLYGCHVASGDAGAEFIRKLQKITKASIAATKTLTGNAELGGNWDLEVKLGKINSQSAIIEAARQAYTGILATNIVISTFDTDTEGWLPYLDATQSWSDFGNPGGSLENVDRGQGSYNGFSAPSNFLGNKLDAFGSTISWDIHVSSNDGSGSNVPDIFLTGTNGLKIVAYLSEPVAQVWNSYSVKLDATQNWKIGDSSGPVATDEQILSVLSNLEQLVIRSEYKNGSDINYLDNVILSGSDDFDNQSFISVSISPTVVKEDGNTNFTYTFKRIGDTSSALNNVKFSVGGSAKFNEDYSQNDATSFTNNSGTISFNPNQSIASITINPTGDQTVEPNESVTLTLADGDNYTIINPNSATGTIEDDDKPTVSVTVSPTSVSEDGNSKLVYTFKRTGNITTALNNVKFNVSGTATFNSDYTQSGATSFNASTGIINFGANQATKTITIDPKADTTVEPNETLKLTLVNGSNYQAVNPTNATGTIIADEPTVSVTVSPSSVSEDSSSKIVYTFRRSGGNLATALNNVRFNVSGSATFNNDYTQSGATSFNNSSGVTNFSPNQVTKTITIDPKADTTVEPSETLKFTLVNSSGYTTTSPNNATGTILNDDNNVSVTVSPANVKEDSSTNLVYTFRRSGSIDKALNNVKFNVSGTAQLNSDYLVSGAKSFSNSSGLLNFGANQATKTITINPQADSIVESNETLKLSLVNNTGYRVINPTSATGTITNDDLSSNSQKMVALINPEIGSIF